MHGGCEEYTIYKNGNGILKNIVSTVESCPKAAGASLAARPQKQDPGPGSSPKIIEPFVTVAKSPLIITNKLPDSKLGKDAVQ